MNLCALLKRAKAWRTRMAYLALRSCSYAIVVVVMHCLTHLVSHSLTRPLSHLVSHSLTQPLIHLVFHSLTHALTPSYDLSARNVFTGF